MYTFHQLNHLLETGNLSRISKQTIELILEAGNDWPDNNINSLDDLLKAVKNKVKGEVSIVNIESQMKKLDLSREAWLGESLASIKEVILLNKEKSLEDVVRKLLK
jgi:hypothetical protein